MKGIFLFSRPGRPACGPKRVSLAVSPSPLAPRSSACWLMWSAQAKASVAPMVLRAVARSRPVRRAFPCLVESCQAPGAVLCEGIAEAVAKNHGGSKTFRGCYQFPSTGGSFASSACTREMSSSG